MIIEKTNYHGWANSYRISNGEVEAIVTADVGPRVMRYGFVGGQNFFKEFKEQLGQSGEPGWQPRGGHRIWIAPEDPVKSYAPDNEPIGREVTEDGVIATAPAGGCRGGATGPPRCRASGPRRRAPRRAACGRRRGRGGRS